MNFDSKMDNSNIKNASSFEVSHDIWRMVYLLTKKVRVELLMKWSDLSKLFLDQQHLNGEVLSKSNFSRSKINVKLARNANCRIFILNIIRHKFHDNWVKIDFINHLMPQILKSSNFDSFNFNFFLENFTYYILLRGRTSPEPGNRLKKCPEVLLTVLSSQDIPWWRFEKMKIDSPELFEKKHC